MTTDITLFKNPNTSMVPAHLAQYAQQSALANISLPTGGSSVPRISTRNNRWTVIYSKEEKTMLEVLSIQMIVVGIGATDYRTWYDKAWDPNAEPTSPECWSANDVTPDPSCTAPRSTNCAQCPMNQWKSSRRGTDAKDCGTHRRIVLVTEGDEAGGKFRLDITGTSVRNFGQYVNMLRKRGFPVECVVTKIGFDPEKQGVLTFDAVAFLTSEQMAAVVPQVNDSEVEQALEINFMFENIDGEKFEQVSGQQAQGMQPAQQFAQRPQVAQPVYQQVMPQQVQPPMQAMPPQVQQTPQQVPTPQAAPKGMGGAGKRARGGFPPPPQAAQRGAVAIEPASMGQPMGGQVQAPPQGFAPAPQPAYTAAPQPSFAPAPMQPQVVQSGSDLGSLGNAIEDILKSMPMAM